MSATKTITDHKAAFIRSQVRQLSTPLVESPAWRSSATTLSPEAEEQEQEQDEGNAGSSIPDRSVNEIVSKVNAKVKAHNRAVFAAATQRHVAEQIDTLYWNEVAAEALKVERNATWVKKNADLCETAVIHSLPDRYRDLHVYDEDRTSGEHTETYADRRARLIDLAQRRDDLKQKTVMYRMLRDLLKPLENARENVQPNLVTKDGDLNRELDKMKTLIARVTGRLGQLQSVAGVEMNAPASTNDDKLTRVMELG